MTVIQGYDFANLPNDPTAASITYSDATGAHMEELTIGGVGEVLTVSAGSVPEWAAAGGAISCADNLTINGITHTICEWIEAGQ